METQDFTLDDINHQLALLQEKKQKMLDEQRKDALVTVRKLVELHGFSVSDIGQNLLNGAGAGRPAATRAKAKVEAKYRNTDTGETWSGRGRKPKWMEQKLASGMKQEDFLI